MENGILKVALYAPDHLRIGGRQPSYEVYIDRNAGRFITYDCANNKWRDSKVDRLEWPQVTHYAPDVWISSADSKMVADYLGSEKSGYKAILAYQRVSSRQPSLPIAL